MMANDVDLALLENASVFDAVHHVRQTIDDAGFVDIDIFDVDQGEYPSFRKNCGSLPTSLVDTALGNGVGSKVTASNLTQGNKAVIIEVRYLGNYLFDITTVASIAGKGDSNG